MPFGVACAAQSTQAQAARFQQVVQQQPHQNVSGNAKLPLAGNAQALQQIEQADRAPQDRDRATQQDLLDRQQVAANLPRVVPQTQPAPTNGG